MYEDATSTKLTTEHGSRPGPVSKTTCDPGVHYTRDDLICVCTKKGTWPHRKCRAIFDKLVAVQSENLETFDDPCTPGLTYLVQCHICRCNRAGQLFEPYCTKMDCRKLTPAVLELSEAVRSEQRGNDQREVYAECTEDTAYKLGCNTCICQKENKLVCDRCDKDKVNRAEENLNTALNDASVCDTKLPGEVFEVDCNTCFCDKAGYTVCTMKACLDTPAKLPTDLVSKSGRSKPMFVEAPADDRDCIPNTAYKKQCNICQCIVIGGKKNVVCTKKSCRPPERTQPDTAELIASIKNDCVEGKVYESDCRTCHCTIIESVKRESCEQKSVCEREDVSARRPGVLGLLHGYCEPLHVYKKDCNTCECLDDGKTVRCTSRVCSQLNLKDINVEILPISQSQGGVKCTKGQNSFKVDCNYCYCLPNGNALCTTRECN